MTLLGLVLYYRGEVDEAERLALQALDWLERTSDLYLQLQNLRELARSRWRARTSTAPKRDSARRCRSRSRSAAGS